MQLHWTSHETDCDLSWTETIAETAERLWMRLAVILVIIASIPLFPLLLILAIVLPSRERY